VTTSFARLPGDDMSEPMEVRRQAWRPRIADDNGTPNHGEAADYFNQLILDLKKRLLGHEHEPITMERLNEGTKHVLELDQCRRPTRMY